MMNEAAQVWPPHRPVEGAILDSLRKPCEHRGTQTVITSEVRTPRGLLDFCICTDCRRFWLEKDGWLLSQREVMSIVRTWPDHMRELAR